MAEDLDICVWRIVANRDLEKIAKGVKNITLARDKPCFKCDGGREYAKKIDCKSYREYKRK